MISTQTSSPGWYGDPSGDQAERYLDGTAWRGLTRPMSQSPAPATGGASGSSSLPPLDQGGRKRRWPLWTGIGVTACILLAAAGAASGGEGGDTADAPSTTVGAASA